MIDTGLAVIICVGVPGVWGILGYIFIQWVRTPV